MQLRKRFHRHFVAIAVLAALSAPALAQLSSATLKGQVTADAGASKAGVSVVAINQANGFAYRTQTQADGSYSLVGLAPGSYSVRVGDNKSTQTLELLVGQTASLDLRVGATGSTELNQVTVIGSAQRQDVKDSQVGTNVSRRMIEAMPQISRNFLSAADLAPGVRFETDAGGNTRLRSGAQNQDAVNVFIDGVGQKNNILRGGISGQDTSQGNPFPQSAIAEYKVISQNYKAEFDQLSAVAITAVTKSGGNELHGDVYYNRINSGWRAYSPVENDSFKSTGFARPEFTQSEKGFSLGGPIKEDVMHFFIAYDGKDIDRPKQIVAKNLDKYPPGLPKIEELRAKQGTFVQPFREDLLFGKLSAQISEEQRAELSIKIRREKSEKLESDHASATTAVNNKNDEARIDFKHEWTRAAWLNEVRAGYEDVLWNPQSDSGAPLVRYKYSPTNLLNNVDDILADGGSPNAQRRGQMGFYLKDDVTWTGMAGHTMKGGAVYRDMTYKLGGTAFRVDAVDVVVGNPSGETFYNGNTCTGTNISNNGLQSDQCRISRAIPAVDTELKNRQYGLYFQDDWAITKQLELNLGVRWDYEDNMLNNSYVTPADRVTALKGLDGRNIAGIQAPAGQTYAQSLAKGGVNIDDYISTGSSRKAFMGAIAPRLGASFDLNGDKATVLFGGWGRSYDRTMANHALDEKQKNAQPGGEIWLIRNDFNMPFSDQLSFGVRQAVNVWNVEAALSLVHAKNQFVWFGGNRDPNGGWGTQSPIDPLWGGPNGYGTLILGDFVGENKTRSILLKAEKPYTKASGWTTTVAYTYSEAETTNKEWTNDIFDWTNGRTGVHSFNPSKDAEKHRLVVAGLADSLLPWGLSVSGKYTYGSGLPRRITDCSGGWNNCVSREGASDNFNQVDVGLAKDFQLSKGAARVRLDVLNLLNTENWGYYDDWGGGPGNPQNAVGGDNANLGKRTGLRGDMRTLKLTLSYSF